MHLTRIAITENGQEVSRLTLPMRPRREWVYTGNGYRGALLRRVRWVREGREVVAVYEVVSDGV